MKMRFTLLICLLFPLEGFCQIHSTALTDPIFLARAKQKGKTQAQADIAKGTMQILYYGNSWPQDKPLVDVESLLPIKIVNDCCVKPEIVVETDAYNAVMRAAAKEKRAMIPASKTLAPAAAPALQVQP